MIQTHAKEKILDAGCGTALITRSLPAGSCGLDINPRNLEKARFYAPHVKFAEGDIENLPFSDNSFDTIIATEVLEHLFPGPKKALFEIERVLETGGVFIGSVPSRGWLWKLRFLSFTHGGLEPYHRHFSKKEIKQILEKQFKEANIITDFVRMNWYFVCWL